MASPLTAGLKTTKHTMAVCFAASWVVVDLYFLFNDLAAFTPSSLAS